MNKTELRTAIAEKTGMQKQEALAFIEAFQEVVTEQLVNEGRVQMVGFGTFDVTHRKERQGRNPQTGEAMTIKASITPKFKAGKGLKDAVNGR